MCEQGISAEYRLSDDSCPRCSRRSKNDFCPTYEQLDVRNWSRRRLRAVPTHMLTLWVCVVRAPRAWGGRAGANGRNRNVAELARGSKSEEQGRGGKVAVWAIRFFSVPHKLWEVRLGIVKGDCGLGCVFLRCFGGLVGLCGQKTLGKTPCSARERRADQLNPNTVHKGGEERKWLLKHAAYLV